MIYYRRTLTDINFKNYLLRHVKVIEHHSNNTDYVPNHYVWNTSGVRSRPNQTQDTLKGKTLPSSRINQTQDSLKGKTLPYHRLYDRLQHRSVVRQSLVRYNLEPHTHTHVRTTSTSRLDVVFR
eukprot:sb/3475769/